MGLHTMKKSYIIPTLQIVKIEQTLPIAGSGSGELTTSGATFYEEDATGAALVKGHNGRTGSVDWDDDWSE